MIASSSDCEGLATLHKRCFETAWDAQSFAQLLSAGAIALVANENEVRCGFILTRVAADEAEILSLGVAPENRGGGLGKRLVTAAAAAATENGAQTMFLEVSVVNTLARRLYTGLGFEETARRRDYYGAGDDAIVLRAGLPLTHDA
jgi:ribosomal-protein-alanine N-acetyltransferase